jgi:hypothetical protein
MGQKHTVLAQAGLCAGEAGGRTRAAGVVAGRSGAGCAEVHGPDTGERQPGWGAWSQAAGALPAPCISCLLKREVQLLFHRDFVTGQAYDRLHVTSRQGLLPPSWHQHAVCWSARCDCLQVLRDALQAGVSFLTY